MAITRITLGPIDAPTPGSRIGVVTENPNVAAASLGVNDPNLLTQQFAGNVSDLENVSAGDVARIAPPDTSAPAPTVAPSMPSPPVRIPISPVTRINPPDSPPNNPGPPQLTGPEPSTPVTTSPPASSGTALDPTTISNLIDSLLGAINAGSSGLGTAANGQPLTNTDPGLASVEALQPGATTTTSSSTSNPALLIAIVVIAGAIGAWWYIEHRKKKHAAPPGPS